MHIDLSKPYCTFMRIHDDGHIFYGWGRIGSAYEVKNMGHGNYTVYVEETFATQDAARRARSAEPGSNSVTNAVRCIETGAVFRSQAEAAHATFVDATRMSQHLRRVKGFKTIRGHTFERLENYMGEFNDDLIHLHSVSVEEGMNGAAEMKNKPVPGSIAAMTETEKEALRSHMRLNGFKPRF